MAQHSVGLVYAPGNGAMPGLVKIGRSSLLSEDRAKQQFTTSVPVPFDVLFRAVMSRRVALEKAVHDLLAPHRVAPNREFFRISPEVAADSILKMRAEVDGIAMWSVHSLLRLRSGDRLLLSMRAGQIFALLAYYLTLFECKRQTSPVKRKDVQRTSRNSMVSYNPDRTRTAGQRQASDQVMTAGQSLPNHWAHRL
jgi:Meiotically up-regulated gene 113